MSFFKDVPICPPNAILGVAKLAREDNSELKVDLSLGAYRDEHGQPVVLPSVREAEKEIYDANMNHEYLGQDGLASFNTAAQGLMFGEGHIVLKEERVYTIQSISGTGSLRLAMDFIKQEFPKDVTVYIPSVTWGNHPAMCTATGLKHTTYSYLDEAGTGLDFELMLQDISAAPEGSIVLLHAIAHNPTGVDPTEAEWDKLRAVMAERRLLPLFDNAYQGFVSGDPNVDAYAVRSWASTGMEMIICSSFAKNFGLYGERTGCVHVVVGVGDAANKEGVASQLRAISRIIYSTCPTFGARIVSTILNSPALRAKWLSDCKAMAHRIDAVRHAVYDRLRELDVKGTWGHVIKQRGMFTFTGIPKEAVLTLQREHHIYLLTNGRASLAGLNQGNVNYFCDCIKAVLGTN